MFNAATKLSYTVAVVAVAAGFGAVFATSDRVAMSNLVFAGVLAASIGIAVFLYAPRDPVVPVSAEVDAATSRSVDVSDLPRPSVWPLVAAVAIALLGVGAAIGKGIIVIGILFALVSGVAWLAQVWREHPSWTAAMTERVNDRYVVPMGLPALAILSIATAAISLSRIFLAVSVEAAPIIAAIVAFALLGAFYLLSKADDIGRGLVAALASGAAVLVVGAGVAGALKGEREFHHAGSEAAAQLSAADLAFDTADLQLPAEQEIVLHFKNEDSAPHNFSMYTAEGGDELFTGDVIDGGDDIDYEITTPEPGSYYFQCDVHPTMQGVVEVAVDASEGEHENPALTPSTTDH